MAENDDKPTENAPAAAGAGDDQPKPAKQGRSLKGREGRPARASAVAAHADDDDSDDDRPRFEDDEDDDERRVEDVPVEGQAWLWNHTHGIRPAIHSEPNRDAAGDVITDGAGMVSWNTISVPLQPGLNVIPESAWKKVREGLKPRTRAGEIEYIPIAFEKGLPVGLDIKAGRLVRAVEETGIEEPLRALSELERRAKVVEAIEKQLASLARGGRGRLAARRIQQVHTVR